MSYRPITRRPLTLYTIRQSFKFLLFWLFLCLFHSNFWQCYIFIFGKFSFGSCCENCIIYEWFEVIFSPTFWKIIKDPEDHPKHSKSFENERNFCGFLLFFSTKLGRNGLSSLINDAIFKTRPQNKTPRMYKE